MVDCAHGAAAAFAPQLLRRAGAEVIAIGAEPDGHNINAGCGSTHLEILSAEVTKRGADAGIAHDGDADRCLAVGADGEVIDGDQILAVLALALASRGELPGNTVVTTVMSNLGFRNAMQDAGITVVETAVGDRYVLEAMRDGHFGLGGEQSGHIIMLKYATTGDGLLTALQLLATAARQALPLADVAAVMTKYPQVLVNVPGREQGPGRASRRNWPRQWPRLRRNSAPPAASWSGPAAPSPPSASWSKPSKPSRPSARPTAWPPPSAPSANPGNPRQCQALSVRIRPRNWQVIPTDNELPPLSTERDSGGDKLGWVAHPGCHDPRAAR